MSQLFFVVGHFSVRMMSYFDKQNDMITMLIGDSNKEEEELEMAYGGKQAQIEEAKAQLNDIREEFFIQ